MLSYVDIGDVSNGASMGESKNDYEMIISYMNEFLTKYKYLISGIYVLILFAILGVFYVKCCKVAAAGKNPMARRGAVTELLFTILALAFHGGIGLICAIVYNSFR